MNTRSENDQGSARWAGTIRGAIDSNEQEELERIARAEASRASMTVQELQRFTGFENRFRVELARQFGDRLSDIITEHLVRQPPLDHRAIQAMVGLDTEVPKSAEDWRALVKEIAGRDKLARLNLAHSDEKAKAALRQKILEGLSPNRRINMSRDGTLEAWLTEQVADSLQRDAGLA